MLKNKTTVILIVLGVIYIIILLKYDIGLPCVFHEMTGLYCAGCGGNRALASILKLDFNQALKYNVLITILILIAPVFFFIKYFFKRDVSLPNWIWYILLIIIVVFAVLRNIPILNFLAPTTK